MFGCHDATLIRLMREAGHLPVVEPMAMKHGGAHFRYYWNPAEVLRVRAANKVKRKEVARAVAAREKTKRGTPQWKAMARHRRAEQERRKILRRIADQKGCTVAELPIAEGRGGKYRRKQPDRRI